METLKKLLKHEDVLAEIFRRKQESNYIESFFDGNLYKYHPLFGITPNSLMLNIYDDEFTIVNPLGSKTKSYKILSFYFTFHNTMPSWTQSNYFLLQNRLLQKNME